MAWDFVSGEAHVPPGGYGMVGWREVCVCVCACMIVFVWCVLVHPCVT